MDKFFYARWSYKFLVLVQDTYDGCMNATPIHQVNDLTNRSKFINCNIIENSSSIIIFSFQLDCNHKHGLRMQAMK